MPLKTFIIEEHHEAFIVWNYAIQQELIPAKENILFHIDEHSDMGTPRFNQSIHNLNGDLTKIKDFTYEELNIACFITPSIYRNIFNKVYWIKQKHNVRKNKSVKMYVRSFNQSGKKLITGKIEDLKQNSIDVDRKEFEHSRITIDQITFYKNVIIDIDLDYFSCTGNPMELEEINIEITKDEYENFKQNKYHRLNFYNIGRIEAIKNLNKYFYRLNYYNEMYPNEAQVSNKIVLERINVFVDKLKENRINPLLINICRSCFSGYTPKEQADYIQENLLKGLKELYELDIMRIDELN